MDTLVNKVQKFLLLWNLHSSGTVGENEIINEINKENKENIWYDRW